MKTLEFHLLQKDSAQFLSESHHTILHRELQILVKVSLFPPPSEAFHRTICMQSVNRAILTPHPMAMKLMKRLFFSRSPTSTGRKKIQIHRDKSLTKNLPRSQIKILYTEWRWQLKRWLGNDDSFH